ncbi:MAG: type II secretion system protein M [Thiohalocapsa sp.]|jgi:general secretion pathway protein M|uniref:type II secretion system protein GspM n=1 Tax=Thiohalocapsa sp. TaxID=2497641 RepID=UPI0025D6754C|nr:type II secretion system protein GspM [Thiohalocapsa sp.]MCG6941196.1 type II secretion system protein M [Thiohalocapsa sp.]
MNEPVGLDAPGSPGGATSLVADAAPDAPPPEAAARPRRTRPGVDCIVAWGALLLLPVLLALAIALPWWQRLQALDADYERGVDQLYRYQRLVATLPGLRAALAREQSNEDFKAFYFNAETPALAGARLQSEVQEMVRAAGARPISTQILPTNEEEQPPRVRIRIQLQGTTDELLDVLHRIESAQPFLFVEQMSIRSTAPRAPRLRGRTIRRRLMPRNVGQLTVRLDIFGYALGGGA